MIKFFKNKKGETILETIIAVSILAIGVTLSSTLMASSLRNINTSKNRVIAVNIAREGIEAVRNIRDTNWLKFSGNARECWNHMPGNLIDSPVDDPDYCSDVCNGATPIAPGDYIVYKAEGTGGGVPLCTSVQRWRLHSPVETLLAPINASNSLLYQVDIEPVDVDTDGDGDFDNDKDIYNHLPVLVTNPANDALGRANAQRTNFSRVITIEYLENTPAALPNDSIDTDIEWNNLDAIGQSLLNRIRVTSKVTWIRGGAEHSVTLKTHLTDYLGRDDLDS